MKKRDHGNKGRELREPVRGTLEITVEGICRNKGCVTARDCRRWDCTDFLC